jgi:hypothetical protein
MKDNGWRKNPRCDAEDKDDTAEEIGNEGVRVFP